MKLLYVPFILQGLIMFADEELHKQRGLSLWERLGHPLDTITVLVPLLLSCCVPYSEASASTFVVMAIFSCLFITKDEFIHAKVCSPIEHLFHALLFVLHPLVFLSTFLAWKSGGNIDFLVIQTSLSVLFLIYQILRWSIPWTLMK